MDTFYDFSAASVRLFDLNNTSATGHITDTSLLTLDVDHLARTTTVNFFRSSTYRLYASSSDGGVGDERIVAVRGVVCWEDLPPVKLTEPERAPFVAAKIKITGLGSTEFTKAVANLSALDRVLTCGFPSDYVSPWAPEQSHGHQAVEFSTRYLSRTADTPYEEFLTPLPGVDPDSFLARITGDRFIHGVDNEVLYYQASNASDTSSGLHPIWPSEFHVGDLIEVRASLRLVWIREEQQWTMKPVLRAVILLDQTFANAARLTRSLATMPINEQPVKAERKAPHRRPRRGALQTSSIDKRLQRSTLS